VIPTSRGVDPKAVLAYQSPCSFEVSVGWFVRTNLFCSHEKIEGDSEMFESTFEKVVVDIGQYS
jgi:hypothetical protein